MTHSQIVAGSRCDCATDETKPDVIRTPYLDGSALEGDGDRYAHQEVIQEDVDRCSDKQHICWDLHQILGLEIPKTL